MMEKIFSKHLEMAYQEFLQAPEARESPIPSCRCAKCAKRNLPNHFLISWQMSLQISLQAARSVLNQIFISRSLAQHRFGVEKQDIFKYLENSINKETGVEMEIKRTGHEIQMGFNERVCSPEEFRVVFVIVNDPEDLSYFQEQKRISVWASLSYCPYSDSFLLNDKPHSQTSPDAKPRLDGKLWNPTRKLDFKQLLFLTELSCVMGEEMTQKLTQKIELMKDSILLDCCSKEDLLIFSHQMTRFVSDRENLQRVINKLPLLQISSPPTSTVCFSDEEVLNQLLIEQNPSHRLITLFYLHNGIQQPSTDEADEADEADDLQQAKIYRNFELFLAKDNSWDQFVDSFNPNSQNIFQDLRLQIEFTQDLATTTSTATFLNQLREEDFESNLVARDGIQV